MLDPSLLLDLRPRFSSSTIKALKLIIRTVYCLNDEKDKTILVCYKKHVAICGTAYKVGYKVGQLNELYYGKSK